MALLQWFQSTLQWSSLIVVRLTFRIKREEKSGAIKPKLFEEIKNKIVREEEAASLGHHRQKVTGG